MEQLKLSYTVGRSTNVTFFGKLLISVKGQTWIYPTYLQLYAYVYNQKKLDSVDIKNTKISTFSNNQKLENCSSIIEWINKFSYVHKMGLYIAIKFSIVLLYTITLISQTHNMP